MAVDIPVQTADDLSAVVAGIEQQSKAQVEIAWPCLHLARAIRSDGFKVTFCTVRDDLFLAIAQAVDPSTPWTRMEDSDRGRRRSSYRVANDLAILRVPEHLREPFAKEWDGAVTRSLEAGLATRTKDGRVKVNRVAGES